jgi:hypothetical protein
MSLAAERCTAPDAATWDALNRCCAVLDSTDSEYAYNFTRCEDGSLYEVRVTRNRKWSAREVDQAGRPIEQDTPPSDDAPYVRGEEPQPVVPADKPKRRFFRRSR